LAKMKKKELQVFFAVTMTSIYRVVAHGKTKYQPYPYAKKIGLRGESQLPLGTVIDDGMMIAVAKHLQSYIPEGHSMVSCQTSYVRNLADVNTMWWKTGTSPIVALFLKKREALDCFEQTDLVPCDPRWLDQTKAVIAAIGDDHPTFTVCRFPGLGLPVAI